MPPRKAWDRPAVRLAEDIPARHFEPGESAHDRRVGALGEAGGIGPAKHHLRVFRAFPHHVPLEDVADHGLHGGRPHGGGIDLAVPHHAARRGNPDEEEVPAAPAGRWVADDKYLEIRQLHRLCPSNRITLRRDRPDRVSSMASLIRESG